MYKAFTATVICGSRHGRTIGYPTANIRISAGMEQALARRGVWAVRVLVFGREYAGVLFWGLRTLFAETKPVCEVHVLDFTQDIYGQAITIQPLAYIRETVIITGEASLIRRIAADVSAARKIYKKYTVRSMVYLGADHAGFAAKDFIKQELDKRSISYADLGANEPVSGDDYVDYAVMVAERVAQAKGARGILICGTGNGVAIAANKIKGVRAAVAWSSATARLAVQDDHANVLALGARVLKKAELLRIVRAFLAARPSVSSRHRRRVRAITKLES